MILFFSIRHNIYLVNIHIVDDKITNKIHNKSMPINQNSRFSQLINNNIPNSR